MGQFGTSTRRWLLQAIRQRKMLLKTNRSKKPPRDVETSVQALDSMLGAYSYENDVYMARFIRQNSDSIVNILPGTGATGHDKKIAEFTVIRKSALQIEENFMQSVQKCGNPKTLSHGIN